MRNIAFALASCAALACAGGRGAEKQPIAVSDSDYGRLRADQTAPVEAARADLGSARDAAARAKLRQTETHQEAELAQADLKAAEVERMRADSAAKAAKESNDPAQLESARGAAENAQLRRRAAEAHLDYAKKLQTLRDAEVGAANQRVAYEEARVERAKLAALQSAQVPAATKYDATKLDARVTGALQAVQQADSKVGSANAQMANAGRTWQELDRQLQARGGNPATRG